MESARRAVERMERARAEASDKAGRAMDEILETKQKRLIANGK